MSRDKRDGFIGVLLSSLSGVIFRWSLAEVLDDNIRIDFCARLMTDDAYLWW